MVNYRRSHLAGGMWFFTVCLQERHHTNLLIDHINDLRAAFRQVRARHPFAIEASVILPDHLHCIWSLPEGDYDFSTRWGLIKAGFSRRISSQEHRSDSRMTRGERGIWQRRFWEHEIRNAEDFSRHMDYIHWNPVKHGYAARAIDWPYSSFHGFVDKGIYPQDWGCDDFDGMVAGE